ncbi:MAG: hypothetical protein ACRDKS_18140 [Actinomycetota bacterium]
MADQKTMTQPKAEKEEQMCCEDGLTAEQHRAQSPDGKCCTD